MFDELTRVAGLASGAEAIGVWARVEAAACSRRLAAMVDVLDRCYAADDSANREQWYLDNWGAVCAEIAAAQRITSGAASNQLLVATALRDRLPRVAARFADGALSYRMVSAVVWRTALIKDPLALRSVDAALAGAIDEWKPMSVNETEKAIDYWIDRFDPHALRRNQISGRSRCFEIHTNDGSGMASLWGTLFAHDAEALDRRLDAIAGTVCRADGRTSDQRRADAAGAMANGLDRLTCRCGSEGCAASVPPSSNVVIHVVARAEDMAHDDPALDGNAPRPHPDKPLRQMTLVEALQEPPPTGPAPEHAGVLMGGPLVPGGVLARLAAQAQVKTIVHPEGKPPEPRYRPSQALADFIRCRDLTCRFPGCDHPADLCDIDHTIAYPVGPTQASNLKVLCRKHHLLKTSWSGPAGWRDRQEPDGTVVWTSPSGESYTTRAGSVLLFPSLCRPTAEVVQKPNATTVVRTGLAMPRRAVTRAGDRARRIESERQLNELAPRSFEPAVMTMPPLRATGPRGRSRVVQGTRRQPTTEIFTYRRPAQPNAS